MSSSGKAVAYQTKVVEMHIELKFDVEVFWEYKNCFQVIKGGFMWFELRWEGR